MSEAFSFKDYYAARGSRFTDKDAKVIGPELERLNADGKGTAADIVDAARPEDAPLHRYFEWSDERAAELYRQTQARHMAAAIVVRVSTPTATGAPPGVKDVRSFLPVTIVAEPQEGDEDEAAGGLKTYTHIAVIRDTPAFSAAIIAEARQQLIGWQRRYQAYRSILTNDSDLASVFEAIDRLQDGEREQGVS